MGTLYVPQRGRKPKQALIEGKVVQLRKSIDRQYSTLVFLPKEWIEALEMKHGRKPDAYAVMDADMNEIVLRAYYDDSNQEELEYVEDEG